MNIKSRLTQRLIIYITGVLVSFAFIVGILFLLLFNDYTRETHLKDLKQDATNISTSLQTYMFEDNSTSIHQPDKGRKNNNHQQNGYGSYLKLLDDISTHDIWLVDRQAQTIEVGNGKHKFTYKQLPDMAKQLVDDVFLGKVITNDSFTPLLKTASISAGAPIYDNDGKVVAALILHSSTNDVQSAFWNGMRMLLFSFVVALFLGIIIAIFLANRFIRPLKRMEKTTQQIVEGNYDSKTNIVQNDEIGQLATSIDIMVAKLKQAQDDIALQEQVRRDFLANISHELRTPVTIIRGFAESLAEGIPNNQEQTDSYYKQMINESKQLERMINDLLELSRLQNPQYSIIKEVININDVLSDAIASIRAKANNKQINIELNELKTPILLEGDYGRLKQMFLIVLDNSIKFSPNNSMISVTTKHCLDEYTIIIKDTGKGISKEDLENIFKRFFKKDQLNGTGLGLAIAKEIADRHDINIKIESELNIGTKVSFCLKNFSLIK